MKHIFKLSLLLISIFILTGCKSEIEFSYYPDKITSLINVEFNIEDFKKYAEESAIDTGNEINDYHKALKDYYENNEIIAIKDSQKYYNKSFNNQDNNNYTITYDYNFNYNNIKNNGLLNNCFSYYGVVEDENNYYFSIKGDLKCDILKNVQFTIKSNNRIYNSNSDKKVTDKHSWIIKEANNDIYYVIAKNDIVNNHKISKYNFLLISIVIILSIITILLYKEIKRRF